MLFASVTGMGEGCPSGGLSGVYLRTLWGWVLISLLSRFLSRFQGMLRCPQCNLSITIIKAVCG